MKKTYYSLGVFSLAITIIAIYFYSIIYGSQIKHNTKIYIKSTDSLPQVINVLDTICQDISDVKIVASLKKYNHIKPGMYLLKEDMNASDIINLLRSGKQTPVKVTFNNQNYVEDLAGRLSHQIEADSISILNSLTNPDFLKQQGFTHKTVLNMCMPYTYECYWTISPNQLRSKLLNAYNRFWDTNRTEKANKLNLTKNEVISLASIIHKETQHKPERKKVAGVYLNRVRVGMPLQADPTIVYAIKEKYGRDTVIKRVLRKDLEINSPYNTYRNRNIPPSAIAMPDIDAIDAVLDAERHSYYYFCASPDKLGTHNFAKNLSQHNRNAAAYQRWLNNHRIHR
ncbi:aminodeoxychorismate lyase [Wenyingzhuangia fucanilytica]|uniref:Endolytic murein transglycosylase n=1 Tax=Wenyingzhuangia fucanilytica TaxID=1790137 RepID=A0A1B1Y5X7_9FLAO|nr:endolytic transglycosylase MltG [Wenyingzhuangia fucanilytica]ANW96138.1 aminodeoxychorismate lyase [Wenyingzhuangia fucanilytica]